MRNIVKNVWSFIDNITNGLVDKDLIDAHKISHEIIDVIKSPNHPSYKKIRNDLFVHIMENIGYYEHLKYERFIISLTNNISYALEHPSEFSKVKNMQIPKFIYGVQEALDVIQNISLCNNFCCNMLEGAEPITVSKGDRCFNIHMEQDWRLNNSEDINVNGAELKLGNLKFLIPKDGSHLHSLNRNFYRS
jgi:hypothetical protein